ncbi:hypothetical protein [uncultured Winogradskyella sp.]|uniref:hypothetical protein n=1 Tax=uncultured Winogradskyella sp. TaxID=395353 RepID=UPI003515911D
MKHLNKLIIALSILVGYYSYSQSTVYVKTNQFGRGILKMRGSETYVITPEHLLKDYYGPITVHGKGSVRARAELLKTYIGDLAVLRFPEAQSLNATKWQLDKNYSAIIENIFEGFIELREEDGSASKVAVTITGVDVQYISIRPKDYREKFYQGMSGSSLFVDYQGKKVFLGMLQSIADDENGSVIRADEMEKILGSFFNPVKAKKSSAVITDKNMTREVDDFRFNLININKSADKVTFEFEVTSLKKDREIFLSNRDIRLYENNGLEYNPNTITIGNKSYRYVDYNLVEGTAVPMKLVFTGVSSSAEFASLLTVGFSANNIKNSFEYKDLYFGDNKEDVGETGKWSKEELGFKFELDDINKTGTEVVITFTATSLNRDKPIFLSNNDIFLYDDLGSEYKPYNISVANKSYRYVEHNLIQDVRVPLILSFKDVASSTKGISLLKVGFSDKKNKGVFQIRNLSFAEKAANATKTQTAVTNVTNTTSKPVSSSNCSDIYFYRKMSMLEYDAPVYLYNHGELIAKLEPGMRFKTTVCDPDRSYVFSVRTNPDEIALVNSKPVIEMGKKYYLKINCNAGISSIKLMDTKKGKKDIANNSKFKRSLTDLTLNEY